MQSPEESQIEPLPTLVFWLFPYNEREMSGQGQRGLLVPDGYRYVSFGERWCNIKGRLTLTFKNDALLQSLGLADAFHDAPGVPTRFDMPNHIMQGIMLAMRGVRSPSNYLAYMENILRTNQISLGFNASFNSPPENLYNGGDETSPQWVTMGPTISGTLQNQTSSDNFTSYHLDDVMMLYSTPGDGTPGSSGKTPYRFSVERGFAWGTSKNYVIDHAQETPRFPIIDKRLDLELWAPPSLNLELSPAPSVGEGQAGYVYLWPGEKISEWVNINPINGKMHFVTFYFANGELQRLAEYVYDYSVDYLIEVRLHPTL